MGIFDFLDSVTKTTYPQDELLYHFKRNFSDPKYGILKGLMDIVRRLEKDDDWHYDKYEIANAQIEACGNGKYLLSFKGTITAYDGYRASVLIHRFKVSFYANKYAEVVDYDKSHLEIVR